jgi:hypothetical protein
MRHQFTPIFRDVLTSRVWAEAHATVRVWLWLQVSADPEGCVPSSLAGVAVGARVTLDEARQAIDFLESVDPDADPSDPLEGRVLERVPRGWRVLTLESDRERAKRESQKARNRKYMVGYRIAKKSTEESTQPGNDVTGNAEPPEVDAPIPIPKPKPSLQEERSPLPPTIVDDTSIALRFRGSADGSVYVSRPVVITRIPEDWRLSDELRSEAVMAGVPPAEIDPRVADLRRGPIGGQRGVFLDELDAYVRGQFGKWKTWSETDRAKAAAATQAPRRFGAPEAPAGPTRERVKGMPEWIYTQHADYALEHGLDLKRAAMAFAKGSPVKPSALRPTDVFSPFLQYLENLAREKGAAA